MKTESIIKALELAKPSLGASDGVLPILSHFVFDGDVIYTYNDVTAVIVEEQTGLQAALHGDTLLALLKAGPADEFQVTLDADNVANIRMAHGWLDLPALSIEGTAFGMPDEKPLARFVLNDALVQGLELCMLSVGQDSLKQEFAGVTFSLVPNGALSLYATDNHSASRAEVKVELAERAKVFDAVMPAQAVQLLLKLVQMTGGGPGPVTVLFGPTAAVVTFPGVTVVSKLLKADAATYAAIFTKHLEAKTNPVPAALLAEVGKASIVLGREPVKECFLAADPKAKALRLVAQGSLGKLSVTLPIDGKWPAAAVNVDPARVATVLPFCDVVGINNASSLVLGNAGFVHIISSRPNVDAPPDKAPRKPTPRVKPRGAPAAGSPDSFEDDIPF